MVVEVLRSTNDTARQSKLAQGNLRTTRDHSINKHQGKTPTEKRKREVDQLSNVDYVPTNRHSSQGESQLYIFKGNEAATESTWNRRSKSNVWTPKNQVADMLTKESFTRDEWNHLLPLVNIMSFSMFSCRHFSNFLSNPIGKQSAMSKRGQEATSSEGSPMAKPK